jgi:hypothetical protein
LGVGYYPGHVGRLLQELRWTPQLPIKRALQRDEEAIGRWRDEARPRLEPQFPYAFTGRK